jgi:predicted nucleic acid-binding protein
LKRVLLDINVVLDVLLDRRPHVTASAAVWAAVETGRAEGLLAAHAVTTIHYLVSKERGAAFAGRTIGSILKVLRVAAVDSAVVQQALALAWPDFEDAVTAAAAAAAGCDLIVTRDPAGFAHSPVTALPPEAAAATLSPGLAGHSTKTAG